MLFSLLEWFLRSFLLLALNVPIKPKTISHWVICLFFFFVELEIPEFTIESLGYLMFVSYVRSRT